MLIKIILYNVIIFLQFYFKLTGHLDYFFDKGSNDKTTFKTIKYSLLERLIVSLLVNFR